MSEATPVRIPLDNVNDETLKLVAWRVKEGQEVQEGQLLAEVETSKALVEMMAPLSGKVWLVALVGQEVSVGAVVAYITTNGTAPPVNIAREPSAEVLVQSNSQPETPGAISHTPEGSLVSGKARALIEKHRIPMDVFAGWGMIREENVKQYLEEHAHASSSAELHFALNGLPVDLVTLPQAMSDKENGILDPKFLAELKAKKKEFAELPSAEKCDLYRKHGAVVGEGVVLGPGTIVIAPQIIIGEDARFAENSVIQCREKFCASRLTSFRRNLTVNGGTVVLGENIYGGTNVQVGGGGNADPWSLLCVGDDTYLGDDIFINICRPVLIGKEVFLTQRSILVTHNVGHSILEGYENRFAPIILADYSQIGMNSTIYAGCTIGRSAIVTSNSYVISSIPDGKLAMGVPARVVRDARRTLDRSHQLQIVETMICDYRELLRLKGWQVSSLANHSLPGFSVNSGEKRFQLVFAEKFPPADFSPEAADETVIWTLESASDALAPGCTLMNLLSKHISGPSGIFANSTREFLRKRGIRCKPGPWRYSQGLI
jgi:acetyltransferase-like isoleucine patch superfamily enzyme